MTDLIGLVGRKGAGKDTAALGLIDIGWHKIAFADPMREMARAINPIVDWMTDGAVRYNEVVERVGYDQAKKQYPELRQFLQRLGTEAGRHVFGESFWIDQAMKRVTASMKPVVVTDVRFLNEAAAIRAHGGMVVRIIRPSQGQNDDVHPSEQEQERIVADYTLVNGGARIEIATELLSLVRMGGRAQAAS